MSGERKKNLDVDAAAAHYNIAVKYEQPLVHIPSYTFVKYSFSNTFSFPLSVRRILPNLIHFTSPTVSFYL